MTSLWSVGRKRPTNTKNWKHPFHAACLPAQARLTSLPRDAQISPPIVALRVLRAFSSFSFSPEHYKQLNLRVAFSRQPSRQTSEYSSEVTPKSTLYLGCLRRENIPLHKTVPPAGKVCRGQMPVRHGMVARPPYNVQPTYPLRRNFSLWTHPIFRVLSGFHLERTSIQPSSVAEERLIHVLCATDTRGMIAAMPTAHWQRRDTHLSTDMPHPTCSP